VTHQIYLESAAPKERQELERSTWVGEDPVARNAPGGWRTVEQSYSMPRNRGRDRI